VSRGFAIVAAGTLAACSRTESADPCAGVDCSQRGACLAEGVEAYCACIDGYHPVGLSCEADDRADPCRGVDCSGHGSCRADARGPWCECEAGFHHPAGTELVCLADAGADADARGDTDGRRDGDAPGDGESLAEGDAPADGEAGVDAEADAGCPPGRADCDGDPANGCETSVADDLANCGACGAICDLPHATESCIDGTCRFRVCEPGGWYDCDGNPANGCEADLGSVAHCGACYAACGPAHATPACVAGRCEVAACDAGWGNCNGGHGDGCEASLATSSNCGSCGHACSGREIWCDGGACAAHWIEIDVRNYIMVDSPGWKLCQSDMACCHDGFRDEDGEWLIGTYCTSGVYMRDYLRRDADAPYLFGVFKNSEYENFRCFANPDQFCSDRNDYPPQAVPLVMMLPILPARVVSEAGGTATGVTPGATLIPEYETWRAFDERGFSATDCHDLGFHGRIWQRNWTFVVDEVDFGGDVGVQRNVWVLESESSGPQPGGDWRGGQRFERYWKTTAYAGVREMGAEDGDCRTSPGAGTCDGVYMPQNITAFPRVVADDYHIPPVCRGF
jgi:hypothetical protein